MRNLMRAALASGLFVLAFAGQAQAATTIGETFDPTGGGVCSPAPRTFLQTAPAQYVAPSAGVITSWSYQAATSPPQLKLKVARSAGGNEFLIVGESTVQTPPPNTLSSFPTRISVQAGDVIGLTLVTEGECYRFAGASYEWQDNGGDPAPGTTAPFSASTGLQFDISARLEPDADGDGFGDETQDQCPTDATTQAACPTPPAPTADCQGATVTKRDGTAGDDTLLGTPAPEAIFGLAGNDTLDGVDGDDCLDGGDGNDTLRGDADDDLEKGGAGDDKVRGQGGKDRLKGQDGVDRLNGGEGKDRLSGGAGKDKLNGSAAKDRLKGNAGDDKINSVDAKTDKVNCGGGEDKATVDPIDEVSNNCEVVRVAAAAH